MKNQVNQPQVKSPKATDSKNVSPEMYTTKNQQTAIEFLDAIFDKDAPSQKENQYDKSQF